MQTYILNTNQPRWCMPCRADTCHAPWARGQCTPCGTSAARQRRRSRGTYIAWKPANEGSRNKCIQTNGAHIFLLSRTLIGLRCVTKNTKKFNSIHHHCHEVTCVLKTIFRCGFLKIVGKQIKHDVIRLTSIISIGNASMADAAATDRRAVAACWRCITRAIRSFGTCGWKNSCHDYVRSCVTKCNVVVCSLLCGGSRASLKQLTAPRRA